MMDSFPVGTNIVACSLPFAAHGSVVAGRVFEVPFEVVYDRVEVQARGPCRCSADHSNAMVAASVPMVRPFVMMEDLNLERTK
jgi:hypothetical protein